LLKAQSMEVLCMKIALQKIDMDSVFS